jgi:two-component system response regulator DesR
LCDGQLHLGDLRHGGFGPVPLDGRPRRIGIAMRVLLANLDPTTRSSLGILFKAQPDLGIVGQPDEPSPLLSQLRAHTPDVMVLDLDVLTGQVDAVLQLLRSVDRPPAVVGMSVRAEKRATAMDMGVDAFAYKGDPPDRLLDAIRTAFSQRSKSIQQE